MSEFDASDAFDESDNDKIRGWPCRLIGPGQLVTEAWLHRYLRDGRLAGVTISLGTGLRLTPDGLRWHGVRELELFMPVGPTEERRLQAILGLPLRPMLPRNRRSRA